MIIGCGYFFLQFEHKQWDWIRLTMEFICIACGFPSTYKVESCAIRMALISCLIGAMVFSTTISAVGITQITTPILNPQIDSIQEIIDGEFHLAGDRFAFLKMSQENEVTISYISLWIIHPSNNILILHTSRCTPRIH